MSVLWPLLVFAGIIGWGSAGCRLAARFGGIEPTSLAERLGIGIAVAVPLIGVAVLVGEPVLITLIVLAGTALAVAELALRLRSGSLRPTRPVLVTTAIGGALIAVVALWAASRSLHFSWLSCDDPNYLYLARRITERGDLADPANVRRIQNLGAMSGIQALYLDQLGDRFLPFADIFLGSVLVLAMLWRTARGRWSPWGIAATAAMLLLFSTLVGMNFNTSPVILPVGFLLLISQLLIRLRAEDRTTRASLGRGFVIGALVAAAFAMRQNVGQPLALLAFVVAVWPGARRLVGPRLGGMLAGGTIGLLPWMVASWRDVATPLYPLVTGNADPDFPTLGARLVALTPAGVLGRVAERLWSPMWIVVLVVALGVVIALYRRRPAERGYLGAALVVQLAATGASIIWLVAMVVIGWNMPDEAPYLISRYFTWMLLGTGLLPIVVINGLPGVPDRSESTARVVSFAVVAVVLLVASFGVAEEVRFFADDLTSGSLLAALDEPVYPTIAGDYHEVVDRLPPGSKVFSAVDLSADLLPADVTVHTLDLVGFASAPPRLPYFEGDESKLDWLRANGYDFLVATVPEASMCNYNRERLQEGRDRDDTRGFAVAWEPYVTDWTDFVDHVRTADGATTAGSLVVIPL